MHTLLVIIGPTGIGKTELSIRLAKDLKTEIISADSRQIYHPLSIGTAIPSPEQLNTVKHYFIHTQSIHSYYNVSMFEEEVLETLENLFRKKDIVVMAGGSMLYIDAICKGVDTMPNIPENIRQNLYRMLETEGLEKLTEELKSVDPIYAQRTDLKNPKRVVHALEMFYTTGKPFSSFHTSKQKARPFKIVKIGIHMERSKLYAQIDQRVDHMMKTGLLEEAKELYAYRDLNALNTVGYKELFDYFDGKHDLDEATRLIKRNTRHYARKQLTWFRKDPDIIWFDKNDYASILNCVMSNKAK
jgi:tRNA dimethylallyltransferase